MSEKQVATSGGMGLVSVLLVIFVVLKMTDVITWSWLTVILMPFIIELGVVFIVLLMFVIVAIVSAILRGRR